MFYDDWLRKWSRASRSAILREPNNLGWEVAIEFLRRARVQIVRNIYPGAVMSPAKMGTHLGWERGAVDGTRRRGRWARYKIGTARQMESGKRKPETTVNSTPTKISPCSCLAHGWEMAQKVLVQGSFKLA